MVSRINFNFIRESIETLRLRVSARCLRRGTADFRFNLSLVGSGCVALESASPRDELIEFELKDDVVKIDGNMAVAWSGSLDFTMERSSKSLLGSVVNGEGLVSVYRGTGKILMTPTPDGGTMETSKAPDEKGTTKGIAVLSKLAKLAD